MKEYGTDERGKEDGLRCYKPTVEDLRRENEALQQENSRLQHVVEEVTAVNKLWQRHNNDQRVYVQKLLAMIQDLQSQNVRSEPGQPAGRPAPSAGSCADAPAHSSSAFASDREVDRLRRQHEEHCQLLRMQIKSHKDDWDIERREKEKSVIEKDMLADEVKNLKDELVYLRGALEEERSRASSCSCRQRQPYVSDASHIASQDFTPRPAYQACFQVPYSPTEEMTSSYSETSGLNAVEPENTAKSPPKHAEGWVGSTALPRDAPPSQIFVGFPDSGLATVSAFSSLSEATFRPRTPPCAATSESPSKPTPQQRPTDSRAEDESVVCPNCSRVFPPSRHLCFLDHFEFCQSTDATSRKKFPSADSF